MLQYSIVRVNFDIPNHVQSLIHLMDEYMRHPMGISTPLNPLLADEIIKGLKNQPNYIGFFVENNMKMVALANCFLNFSTFKAQQLLNIHDFVVDSECNGRGVGRYLIDEICNWAQQYGCCRVNLEVRVDNKRAMKLYKGFGFNDCTPPMLFWERNF